MVDNFFLSSNFDIVNHRKKTLITKFDEIELHHIFPQTWMVFDGIQPIEVQFKVDIICLPNQKHMVKRRWEKWAKQQLFGLTNR